MYRPNQDNQMYKCCKLFSFDNEVLVSMTE